MTPFATDKDYQLEDDRVMLRPLRLSDYDHLLPFALNEPELWRYSLTHAAGPDGLQQYMQAAWEGRASGKEYPFIVFDKAVGAYAGSTRFYDIQQVHQTTQLGYTWYGKAFQGTGLNRHCKFLLLDFAFEAMQAVRVEFRADAANQRSIAAMKSIGCKVEGILRSHMLKHDGIRRDSIILSMLKNEWETGARAGLQAKLM